MTPATSIFFIVPSTSKKNIDGAAIQDNQRLIDNYSYYHISADFQTKMNSLMQLIEHISAISLATSCVAFLMAIVIFFNAHHIDIIALFGISIETVMHGHQFYRLFSFPFVIPVNVLGSQGTVILTYFSRMEKKIGSLQFVRRFMEAVVFVGAMHLIAANVLLYCTQDTHYVTHMFGGLWPVFLAMVATIDRERFVLFIFFEILSYKSFLNVAFNVIVGYLFSKVATRIDAARIKQWEDKWIPSDLITRHGFVSITNKNDQMSLDGEMV